MKTLDIINYLLSFNPLRTEEYYSLNILLDELSILFLWTNIELKRVIGPCPENW
jgi:hypothetical protein